MRELLELLETLLPTDVRSGELSAQLDELVRRRRLELVQGER